LLQRLPRSILKRSRAFTKIGAIFFLTLAAVLAQQDVTNYLTPGVARVGERLSCRCGGCKETIGKCPMLRCDSADPKRRRIFEMQARGMSDDAIVNTFVREEGIVALSSPLPLHLITWLATPIALLLGFWLYLSFVKRNRKLESTISTEDQAMIDRFRAQMDRELDESPELGKQGANSRK
jgi:cytochrome c-type biogenesis protein CcmH/NrfF